MTPNIDEIRQRAERATPGPWCVPAANVHRVISLEEKIVIVEHPEESTQYGMEDYSYFRLGEDAGGSRSASDRRFIAHARTDVPALCAEVERLRACEKEASTELHRLAQDLGLPDDGPMENRVAAVEMVNRLRAENAKLREVARQVMRDFPPYQEVEHVDNGPDDPKEVPTGERLCGSCSGGLDEHDADCLYALAERALANGGAGGG